MKIEILLNGFEDVLEKIGYKRTKELIDHVLEKDFITHKMRKKINEGLIKKSFEIGKYVCESEFKIKLSNTLSKPWNGYNAVDLIDEIKKEVLGEE